MSSHDRKPHPIVLCAQLLEVGNVVRLEFPNDRGRDITIDMRGADSLGGLNREGIARAFGAHLYGQFIVTFQPVEAALDANQVLRERLEEALGRLDPGSIQIVEFEERRKNTHEIAHAVRQGVPPPPDDIEITIRLAGRASKP